MMPETMMHKTKTRRHFLKGALATLALGGGLASWIWWRRRDTALGLIKQQLSYLRLDRQGVRGFLDDYRAAYGSSSVATTDVSRLALHFLMSSDFFEHDGDQTRTVRFVRLYDPYVNPCHNPLARFD